MWEVVFMDGFRKKGSLTVEAVLVVPVCLMVCFFLLQTLFYLHHVSWYTAAAWECALTGLSDGGEGETARQRWQSLKDQQPLPVGKLQTDISSSGQNARVRIRGNMSPLAGLKAMEFDITVNRSTLAPASFLKKAKSLKVLAKGQG